MNKHPLKRPHKKTGVKKTSLKKKPSMTLDRARLRIMLAMSGMGLLLLAGVLVEVLVLVPRQHAKNAELAAAAMLSTIHSDTPPGPNAYANLSLIGKAAIVYDLSTGQTLYEQNANASLPLASITKLLTLYAASGILTPTSPVTMTPFALAEANDAADTGFKVGETFNYEDLARLTLAASSNAGADSIADAASAQQGMSVQTILENAAHALNLTHTHATNGSGLDVNAQVSGGYGSARDIAVLAGALLQKAPDIAHASAQASVRITSSEGMAHSFANTDIDVTHFPNLLLSKTGFTDLAGGNLVIVYDAGINHPIAVVILGSTQSGRFTDMRQLTAATLAHFAGTGVAGASNTVSTSHN